MSLTKEKKSDILNKLSEALTKSQTLLFTNFSGMSVEKIKELRKELQAGGASYRIVKKSLLQIALKKAKIDIGDIDFKKFPGSMGVVFGQDNQVVPTHATHTFANAKENKKVFTLLGASFLAKPVDSTRLALLAKATSHEDLIAGLLRQFIAPVSKLVYALQAISEKE